MKIEKVETIEEAITAGPNYWGQRKIDPDSSDLEDHICDAFESGEVAVIGDLAFRPLVFHVFGTAHVKVLDLCEMDGFKKITEERVPVAEVESVVVGFLKDG